MILFINTTKNNLIEIIIKEKDKIVVHKKIKTQYNQAEKLLPLIDSTLKEKRLIINSINKIIIANKGGSFSSLRTSVVTANALAYALGITVESTSTSKQKLLKIKKSFQKINIVQPIYTKEPSITTSTKRLIS